MSPEALTEASSGTPRGLEMPLRFPTGGWTRARLQGLDQGAARRAGPGLGWSSTQLKAGLSWFS